jgi:hypothetical protein
MTVMRGGRALLLLILARLGFSLGFMASALRGSPLLWYFPLERRWSYELQPLGTHLGMDWFGRVLEGLAWALGAALLGLLGTSWRPLGQALLRPERVLLLARTLALVLLFDLGVQASAVLSSAREPFVPAASSRP